MTAVAEELAIIDRAHGTTVYCASCGTRIGKIAVDRYPSNPALEYEAPEEIHAWRRISFGNANWMIGVGVSGLYQDRVYMTRVNRVSAVSGLPAASDGGQFLPCTTTLDHRNASGRCRRFEHLTLDGVLRASQCAKGAHTRAVI